MLRFCLVTSKMPSTRAGIWDCIPAPFGSPHPIPAVLSLASQVVSEWMESLCHLPTEQQNLK